MNRCVKTISPRQCPPKSEAALTDQAQTRDMHWDVICIRFSVVSKHFRLRFSRSTRLFTKVPPTKLHTL